MSHYGTVSKRSGVWTRAALLFIALGATSCATAAPPGQCKIEIALSALDRVNPDDSGRALPVTLRFIQLKDTVKFEPAGFDDVWLRAPQVLAEALVDSKEVAIFPGENRREILSIKEDTAHVGIAAIFHRPQGAIWRTWVTLPPPQTAKRCSLNRPGGPYYVLLENTTVKSSTKPLTDFQKRER